NPSLTSESKMDNLPDTCYLLLDIILKSKQLIRVWIEAITKCIKDGFFKEMEYEAAAYILCVVIDIYVLN
ncbi:Hypothetical predicted protein, partial [Paramuricea clavata]